MTMQLCTCGHFDMDHEPNPPYGAPGSLNQRPQLHSGACGCAMQPLEGPGPWTHQEKYGPGRIGGWCKCQKFVRDAE